MALIPVDRLGDYILVTLLGEDGSSMPSEEAFAKIEARFGNAFGVEDRAPVTAEEPDPTPRDRGSEDQQWKRRTYIALRRLLAAQWVRVDRRRWALTPVGESAAQEAEARLGGARRPPVTKQPDERGLVRASVMANALLDPDERARMGLPVDESAMIPVLVELNVLYRGGVREALGRLQELAPRAGEPLTEDIVAVRMSMSELRAMVKEDASGSVSARERAIHRVWPDFPVQPLIDSSCRAVKADAARRSFSAFGEGVVWAVVDSGIDREHPHFHHELTVDHDDVRDLHRDFTASLRPDSNTAATALVDERGHGTHVAGIIAGQAPPADSAVRVDVLRDQYADAEQSAPGGAVERATAATSWPASRRRPGS